MAVTSVQRIWAGQTGSAKEKAAREYTAVWRVIVSALTDDFFTVTAAPGIPALFSLYVGNDGIADPLGAICRDVSASQPDVDCPFLWHVVAKFSNQVDQPELSNQDPLSRPAEIEWDWVSSTRVLAQDLDGKPVVNSSNEPFDPPVEVDDYRMQVRMIQYLAAFDVTQAMVFKDAVNLNAWAGFAPGFAKMKPIKAVRHFENNHFYYQRTVEVMLRGPTDQPFQPTVLDAGFREIKFALGAGITYQNIFDHNGQPTQIAVPLNGAGQRLDGCNDALAGAIDNETTDITTLHDFQLSSPQPAFPFDVEIDSEIMTVESVNNANQVFTVVRGARGTTRAAHSNGAAITVLPIYKTFKGYNVADFSVLGLPL